MPECIKPYCRVGDNLDVASRYRILVTTCVSVGVLFMHFQIFLLKGMPECIKPYCRVGDDLDVASRYRILVTTCVSAGVLYGQGTHSQVIFYRVCLNV